MRSKLPHIDNLSNKQLWNLINISYSIQWIIFATCLTQNTTIDINMPHWRFMQQVATRGSNTRQGNVFCNTESYMLPYILHKQPLGAVLHSVEICFVTSLLKIAHQSGDLSAYAKTAVGRYFVSFLQQNHLSAHVDQPTDTHYCRVVYMSWSNYF